MPSPSPIRWWNTVDSRRKNRYYVESVAGWPINPRIEAKGQSSQKPSRTWFVIDSAECHREVEIFRPNGGRTEASCKARADSLCAELHLADRLHAA